MDGLPEVRIELEGWSLFFALLEVTGEADSDLDRLRDEVAELARQRWRLETLARDPTVAALRSLFRAVGCDPTRYRPSSEALIRRVLKGDAIPAISPLVDINNCLSLSLAVPCCVMAQDKVAPPFTLRAGREGEAYESLRGPFKLASRPVLADRKGPCDAPITGSQRVKVTADTKAAWLVAYLPSSAVPAEEAQRALDESLNRVPVARLTTSATYSTLS